MKNVIEIENKVSIGIFKTHSCILAVDFLWRKVRQNKFKEKERSFWFKFPIGKLTSRTEFSSEHLTILSNYLFYCNYLESKEISFLLANCCLLCLAKSTNNANCRVYTGAGASFGALTPVLTFTLPHLIPFWHLIDTLHSGKFTLQDAGCNHDMGPFITESITQVCWVQSYNEYVE